MAQEDSSRTFSTIAPSRIAHSPYASSYANLAENIGDQWVDSNKLRDVMAVAGFISQQDRAEREAKRNAFYEDLRSRAEQRAQERADRYAAKQDYREHLMDQADQLIGKIEMIDPMHVDANKALQELRSSQNFGRLLANRDTRQAVLEAFKNKAKEHDDILGGFMQEGKTKYGFAPSMGEIPLKADRTFDTEKFYSTTLPSLGQQMQQKAQQTYEATATPEGRVKYAEYNEYGYPVAKFVAAPKIKPVKPEDIKKEFKTTYGAPVESLSMQFGTKPVKGGISVIRGSFEDGEFKPSESGDTVQVVDASKGMSKKVIHNIPYEQFESFRSKVQGVNAPSQIISTPEGVDISSPIGVQSGSFPQLRQPTLLPSPTPEATTDASPSPAPMPLGDIFK